MAKPEHLNFSKTKTSDYIYVFMIAALVAAASVFTVFYMGADCFRHDELYSISFFSKSNSLGDMLRIFITDEVTNPPLYYIFMYYWYRIVPPSETWLLLPNYFFFLTGLTSLGWIVLKYTEKLSCIFVLTAITWINAYTFCFMIFNLRAYCLLFMFSSLAVFQYCRALHSYSYKNRLILGLLFFCMCFTHYYGILVAAGYGLFDLFLVITKRKPLLKSLISYLILIVLISPYLLIAFMNRQKKLSQFWGRLPSPLRVIKTIAQFFGNEYLFIVFMLMAGIWLIFMIRWKMIPPLPAWEDNGHDLLYAVIIWVGSFTFAVSYIYSYWINPNGGIYVEQYFISVKPLFLLLFCFLFSFTINRISEYLDSKISLCFALSASVIILLLAIFGGSKWYDRHLFKIPSTRNLADYIKNDQDNNSFSKAAIYVYNPVSSQWNVPKYPVMGLKEFYLDPLGIDIPILISKDEIPDYDKIYFWYEMFCKFDDNIPSIEPAYEIMKDFHLADNPETTGMWVFERN